MKRIKSFTAISAISIILAILTATALLYDLAETEEQEQGQEQAAVKEEFFNYTLHFCSLEDCMQTIISQLHGAKASAKCALYRVGNSVIESIPDSVSAEIVVDEKAMFAAANFSPIGIYKPDSRGIMHNKYCVIDGSIVITGSFNPVAAAKNDYNDLLVINSTSLAAFYNSNFEQLKGSKGQKTAVTAAAVTAGSAKAKTAILNETSAEVYFCPRDRCAEAVKGRIREANSSIAFAAYSFTHPEIANELILKRAEGLTIAGVIERSTTGSKYSKHSAMAANGIELRLEASKKLLHYKFFVIDNETVITGSFNPTKNADERNDENVIVIRNKELARTYAEEFREIFGDADAQK